MLEFIFLLVIALLCYCIPIAGRKEQKDKDNAVKPVAKQSSSPNSQILPQAPNPQPEQQSSIDSLYLNEDFDIDDLINAGKDNKNDDT